MNRDAISNRSPLAAIGPEARELTDAELDAVSGGGMRKAAGDPPQQPFLQYTFG